MTSAHAPSPTDQDGSTAPSSTAAPPPERCVVVVDDALPTGLAANAAAVLALSLGAAEPGLVGAPFVDADGRRHPGLIDRGLPVLTAPHDELQLVAAKAMAGDAQAILFPTFGQRTTDYETFRRHVAETPSSELVLLAVLVHGPKRTVGKLTGSFALLR